MPRANRRSIVALDCSYGKFARQGWKCNEGAEQQQQQRNYARAITNNYSSTSSVPGGASFGRHADGIHDSARQF